MRLATYLGGAAVVLISSQQITKAQDAIVDNLSKAERIKQIMFSYEQSHTSNNTDSTASAINGITTLHDSDRKILKKGLFKDGTLIDGEVYKYDSNGKLIEKHIYRGSRFITKISQ